jgi:hypothetical protein
MKNLLILTLVLLTSCGGSSGGAGSNISADSGTPSKPTLPAPIRTQITAQLIATKPVAGIQYRIISPTATYDTITSTGVTDANGQFKCKTDDHVVFSLAGAGINSSAMGTTYLLCNEEMFVDQLYSISNYANYSKQLAALLIKLDTSTNPSVINVSSYSSIADIGWPPSGSLTLENNFLSAMTTVNAVNPNISKLAPIPNQAALDTAAASARMALDAAIAARPISTNLTTFISNNLLVHNSLATPGTATLTSKSGSLNGLFNGSNTASSLCPDSNLSDLNFMFTSGNGRYFLTAGVAETYSSFNMVLSNRTTVMFSGNTGGRYYSAGYLSLTFQGSPINQATGFLRFQIGRSVGNPEGVCDYNLSIPL